jgi:signal transduction histidine kinase
MPENTLDTVNAEIDLLRSQVDQLSAINRICLQINTTLDFSAFVQQFVTVIAEHTNAERATLLVAIQNDHMLEYAGTSHPLTDRQAQAHLETIRLSIIESTGNPLVRSWTSGFVTCFNGEDNLKDSGGAWFAEYLQSSQFCIAPVLYQAQLIALVIIDNPVSQSAVTALQQRNLEAIVTEVGVAIENARAHRRTKLELNDNLKEMQILQKIDRELNDTIDLKRVFSMTLDWALRFTNAQYASLSLYDEEADDLRFDVDYGYEVSSEQLAALRREYGAGITARVAHSGYMEVVPDVSLDADYVPLAARVRSQLSVPVKREDRVVAVITLESKKPDGFTDQHLEFVGKLATRAAVAIDNARLYQTAIREREKVSHILSNTADVVIVVNTDGRVMLVNESAIAALQLRPAGWAGQPFAEAIDYPPLVGVYDKAVDRGDNLTEEVVMPSGRIFHANLKLHEGIGWIIVLHDITPFKEMDRLKNELIATVSHDLKQPLGVMGGYLELLSMQKAIAPAGEGYANMIRKAVQNMRQLIDDLLDLAKIEAGVTLDLRAVPPGKLIAECIESLKGAIDTKQMQADNLIDEDYPAVRGDPHRLRQIFLNLIGNAVKYTPPGGHIVVFAERREHSLRLCIQDNGMGISPEDQIHVFERFYRVRRPETDSIEGTGLGLAIVKTLVEAHGGQITLESRLGEGTTFFVTLPLAE